MKATVLYCDRCHGEGKAKVPAALMVWIRTSLGGRPLRLDVCREHFATIVGQSSSSNGAAPPTTPSGERVWSKRGGGVVMEQKVYNQLLALSAKHARFSLDAARAALGKDGGKSIVGRVLRLLVKDGKLERHMAGVYQRPGYAIPEPATAELAAAAVLKLVRASPGIRGAMAAPLLGIERVQLWRTALAYLREHKLMRTKGGKSAMRLYPL